ncbi:MAG: tRNA (adenosine(37)-N6)-dimethylallyltransferase MiaA [Methylomicrobium sp.]
MSDPFSLPPAILVMGPTASGKSALAIELAAALGGEIISVDSALVYRGMDIGTAKPDAQARRGIPHHLINILDPAESFSTGQFRAQALKLMEDMIRRGKIPILAGGTMLYFNALTQGLAALPKADPAIRARLDEDLQRLGSAILHHRLREIDPEAAARIHPNDPQRIQRALEVFEISGMPLSSFFGETSAQKIPYRLIKLIIAPEERATLHSIIAERFRQMLRDGLIEEVEALYRRGDLDEKMPAIRAVGYRQVWAYLAGEYDYESMTKKGIIATRQLAKRQFTWLRRETDALRYHSGQTDLLQQALADIQRRLG